MDSIKVSIIIPVYNVEPYIERCLLSVLNQSYQDIEIILIDDCGQDNSMIVAQQIVNDHPNGHKVHILKHEYNRGLSAARNTGIEASIGEYIYFLDSDDEIMLDCIEKLSKPLENQKLDFVIGNYQVIGCEKKYPLLKLKQGILLSDNDKILLNFLKKNWYEMAWNKLLNKKFILNYKLFFLEGLLHEDKLWSFMLACQAKSMDIVPDFTYNYFIRDNSIIQTNFEKRLPHLLKLIEELINYAKNNGLSSNLNVCNYIERFKWSIFHEVVVSNSNDSAKRKEIYNFFRKCILSYSTLKKNSKKEIIRDGHYLFCSKLGYYIYMLLLYISIEKNRLKLIVKNFNN